MSEIDKDGSGSLDFDEFKEIMHQLIFGDVKSNSELSVDP